MGKAASLRPVVRTLHFGSEAIETSLSVTKLGKLERRRKILAAARKLFARHGYENVRPQDIIREAGVAYGTFYDNFSSKRDCFLAFADEAAHEVYEVTRRYLPDSGPVPRLPSDFFRGVLRAMFDYSLANPGVLREMFTRDNYVRSDQVGVQFISGHDEWVPRILKWKSINYIADEYDTHVLADVIIGVLKLGEVLITQDPAKKDRIIDNMTRFLVRAIQPSTRDASSSPKSRKKK